jgi:hypothetical protein
MSNPKAIGYAEAVTKAILDAECITEILGDLDPFSPFADWINEYTLYLDTRWRAPHV